jgi:hypothetical protein
LSPFFAAWLAKTWETRLPDSVLQDLESEANPMASINNPTIPATAFFTEDILPSGGWPEARTAYDARLADAEKIRKGSKEIRDRFYQRMASLGQSVSGLPQEIRQALLILDKPVSWSAKLMAELDLDLYMNKLTGKTGILSSEKPTLDSIQLADKLHLLKDLSQKKRKL